jgi:hypothetical protein
MYAMTEHNAIALLTASIEFYKMRKQVKDAVDKVALATKGLTGVRDRYMQERAIRAAMGLPFGDVDGNIAIVDNLLAQLKQK